MESYVRHLYQELSVLNPTWKFFALASKELAAGDYSWFPGEVINSGISTSSSAKWALAETFQVQKSAHKVGADLIHSPANIGPQTRGVPVVLTVQDLLSFRHPEYVPGGIASRVLRSLIRRSVKAASEILTISESSAYDIRTYLDIENSHLTVVPLSGGHADLALPTTRSQTTYFGARPFLLTGGNRLPHKNFATLLHALALIDPEHRPGLIVTGGSTPDPLKELVTTLALEQDVLLLNWVSTQELEDLYVNASLYVFPTRFEGFGLPVLEAMSRGVPVLCSDLPVLREVGGSAAMFCDTMSAPPLAAAISDIMANDQLRQKLSQDGRVQAAHFTWQKTAKATAEIFERAARLTVTRRQK